MKTIIFDFGNVVGFFDHQLTLARLAAHTEMTPGDMYSAVYDSHMEDAFESGNMTQADFLAKAKHLCGLRCDESFMQQAFADIFRPNPEVCTLIPKLKKNYRLMLGSNTNELHAAQFLEQFAEVLAHFDDLVLSYRIRTRKPGPGFFEHCHRLAGCRAEECLFIDDLPANIAGARAAGLQGLLYRGDGRLAAQLAALGIVVDPV